MRCKLGKDVKVEECRDSGLRAYRVRLTGKRVGMVWQLTSGTARWLAKGRRFRLLGEAVACVVRAAKARRA